MTCRWKELQLLTCQCDGKPPQVTGAAAGPDEARHDVAIRVEQAHARYGHLGQLPLTARLPQQVLGPEHRLLCVLLPGWQRPPAFIDGICLIS